MWLTGGRAGGGARRADDLVIDEGERMPPLANAEAVLLTAADAGLAARRLADHLAHALEDEPARF